MPINDLGLLRFRNLPADSQVRYDDHMLMCTQRSHLERCGTIVITRSFAGGLILSLTALLLVYLYGKLNDAKLTKIPPEVKAQATCNFSPENIRLTAARLKESPLRITSRLPPRTGRRYIVVGGVTEGS